MRKRGRIAKDGRLLQVANWKISPSLVNQRFQKGCSIAIFFTQKTGGFFSDIRYLISFDIKILGLGLKPNWESSGGCHFKRKVPDCDGWVFEADPMRMHDDHSTSSRKIHGIHGLYIVLFFYIIFFISYHIYMYYITYKARCVTSAYQTAIRINHKYPFCGRRWLGNQQNRKMEVSGDL